MERATSKRKEREKEARREAILDAAARVLSVKSYYEATLDEIAAEAELAKGTLYNYYKDKPTLFFSLMRRGFDLFQQHVNEAISEGGPLPDLVYRTLKNSLCHMTECKYMLRVIISAGAHLSEDNQQELAEMIRDELELAAEKLAEAFAVLPETKNLPEEDRLTGAKMLFASARQIHIRLTTSQDDQLQEEEIENYSRLLVRALTTEKPE